MPPLLQSSKDKSAGELSFGNGDRKAKIIVQLPGIDEYQGNREQGKAAEDPEEQTGSALAGDRPAGSGPEGQLESGRAAGDRQWRKFRRARGQTKGSKLHSCGVATIEFAGVEEV